jgi:murein DD-endopeptidase MepM/ murein hydrolase activator NlpD
VKTKLKMRSSADAAGGIVMAVDWRPEHGHELVNDHGNGVSTRHAHRSAIGVKLGALVRRGQPAARASGCSTGPHPHFEAPVDGVPQDPARFLAGSPSSACLNDAERRVGKFDRCDSSIARRMR